MNETLDIFSSARDLIEYKSENALLDYYPYFFQDNAVHYFSFLKDNVPWQQDKIKMYGKEINLPRKTAWYGEQGRKYSYSGIEMQPLPFFGLLKDIKKEIEECSEVSFNSVLMNYYKDGQDYVSWHSDDEKELGPSEDIFIASVSLGADRDFQLKNAFNKDIEKINISLRNGSLLLMKPPTQKFWLHQIPKRKKLDLPRINLTFRKII